MYMTYVSGQMSLIYDRPPFTITSTDEFRPTWLVRVSDMARVPGTDAKNGYCTLSYSWNYSGDLIQGENGEYECIDNGQHKIIYNTKGKDTTFFDQGIKHVKFEGLIQQLCKDFDIEYIWYDKMCIDQTDKIKKHTEIKQMHEIYRNARFAVAMIPEMSVPDGIKKVSWTSGLKNLARVVKNEHFSERAAIEKCIQAICNSEWFKRMWTLEEAIMSNHIVFVGKNAHLWLGARVLLGGGFFLSASMAWLEDLMVLWPAGTPSANTVLRHAHARYTTKEHDRVYALANVYAGIIDIDVNYDRPIMTVMNEFYANLLENDLSVLCFGKPRFEYKHTMRGSYALPSWTGIGGTHVQDAARTTLKTPQDYFSIDTKDSFQMRVNCGYISVSPQHFPTENEKLSRFIVDGGLEFTHYIRELASVKNQEKITKGFMSREIPPGTDNPVTFMSLTEECSECLVLDMPFKWEGSNSTRLFPVIRQNGAQYKAIGILFVRCRVFYYRRRAGLSEFTQTNVGSFVIA
ncbi:heterokaryon incompatibility protein-domain-containing protein [Fennellomyces sp. T-0311]|nr:heterokaryon incompatibility protein-domain-containing protein [Fennellomyces sp. T-0311]